MYYVWFPCYRSLIFSSTNILRSIYLLTIKSCILDNCSPNKSENRMTIECLFFHHSMWKIVHIHTYINFAKLLKCNRFYLVALNANRKKKYIDIIDASNARLSNNKKKSILVYPIFIITRLSGCYRSCNSSCVYSAVYHNLTKQHARTLNITQRDFSYSPRSKQKTTK